MFCLCPRFLNAEAVSAPSVLCRLHVCFICSMGMMRECGTLNAYVRLIAHMLQPNDCVVYMVECVRLGQARLG